MTLNLYPNPSSKYLMVRFNRNLMPGNYVISIRDLQSKQILQHSMKMTGEPNGDLVIPVELLPSGLYIFAVEGPQIMIRQNFIKVQS